MTIYCTYCSADKDDCSNLLPAIERYASRRIRYVSKLAKTNGKEFFILSAKYGLLKSDDQIPYYDHLLTAAEVNEHAEILANQIQNQAIAEIHFYSRSVENDPNIAPYQDCLELASNKCGVELNIIIIDEFN
ncbi:hypothetical protein JYT74_01790 [Crocinitomix catalasitica]|nr:hypothetical protein [Crocinitomix catalasitica]